jgi:hypothetical protein
MGRCVGGNVFIDCTKRTECPRRRPVHRTGSPAAGDRACDFTPALPAHAAARVTRLDAMRHSEIIVGAMLCIIVFGLWALLLWH